MKRIESAQLYRQNDRIDLAEPEEQELAVLKEYLPEQLGEDDVRRTIEVIISDMGEVSIQMGQVIGAAKSKLWGNSG